MDFSKAFQAPLTSAEFVEIFKKYDTDGNGYIEKKELDAFLNDLLKNKERTADNLGDLKKSVLEKYDTNSDSKISMNELALILPTEDNFLEHFREENVLHIADFMKIWYHYDSDKSGYLETNELQEKGTSQDVDVKNQGFLRDLLASNQPAGNQVEVTPESIENYADVINVTYVDGPEGKGMFRNVDIKVQLDLFDKNKDGKIELSELAKILPVQDNFFKNFQNTQLSEEEFNKIFAHYDQDGNGVIEDSELAGFLRDLLENKNAEPNTTDLERYRTCILDISDTNKDGRLSKEELKLFLLSKSD